MPGATKFLMIQTAFIGDVVLATGIAEKIHRFFPDSSIDFLVRKGNEGLLKGHPYIHTVIWDKKKNKYKNLFKLLRYIRKQHYTKVINVQRFAATGLLTAFSGADETIGFDKNPWSFCFTKKIKHRISSDDNHVIHEIERNNDLVKDFTDDYPAKPRLYPSPEDYAITAEYRQAPYICIAPSSVWFTKQYPKEKWISFINSSAVKMKVYLLGGPTDHALCEEIKNNCQGKDVENLCGKLNFLQSAALMRDAIMNYVNDSAPMHFASSVNAPVSAVYCSTIPGFGFGPLSDKSFVIEAIPKPDCRPCSLHGKKECPLGHFKCAYDIRDEQLAESIESKK